MKKCNVLLFNNVVIVVKHIMLVKLVFHLVHKNTMKISLCHLLFGIKIYYDFLYLFLIYIACLSIYSASLNNDPNKLYMSDFMPPLWRLDVGRCAVYHLSVRLSARPSVCSSVRQSENLMSPKVKEQKSWNFAGMCNYKPVILFVDDDSKSEFYFLFTNLHIWCHAYPPKYVNQSHET